MKFPRLGPTHNFLIVFGLGFFLVVSLSRSIYLNWDSQKRIETKRQEVEDLEKEVGFLEEEIEFYQSEGFLEEEARNRLQLVKPGETLIVVPEEAQKELNERVSQIESESENRSPNNWQEWAKLFLDSDQKLNFKFDF